MLELTLIGVLLTWGAGAAQGYLNSSFGRLRSHLGLLAENVAVRRRVLLDEVLLDSERANNIVDCVAMDHVHAELDVLACAFSRVVGLLDEVALNEVVLPLNLDEHAPVGILLV